MEINEAIKKKTELESKITLLLQTYENETGLHIGSIQINRSGLIRGFGLPPITDIVTTVTI